MTDWFYAGLRAQETHGDRMKFAHMVLIDPDAGLAARQEAGLFLGKFLILTANPNTDLIALMDEIGDWPLNRQFSKILNVLSAIIEANIPFWNFSSGAMQTPRQRLGLTPESPMLTSFCKQIGSVQ